MLLFLLELLKGLFLVGHVRSASFPQPLAPAEERQAVMSSPFHPGSSS